MTTGKSISAYAKSLIGRPYSEIDCIKLVVLAIRNGEGANGESLKYQCGGTNELWRSIDARGKYRYVTNRVELSEAKAMGLLAPGALLTIWEPGYNAKYGDTEGDCSHIGIYVGDDDCEVVHSSATRGCVAASTLKNGWTHVLLHRLIDTGRDGQEALGEERAEAAGTYQANVCTEKDPLTIRAEPSTRAAALGKVRKGGCVTVVGAAWTDESGRAWLPVEAKCDNRRSAVRGWAAAEYLEAVEKESQTDTQAQEESMDSIGVPREEILALADAVNILRGAASYNAADYLRGVEALLCASEAIMTHLKGDD